MPPTTRSPLRLFTLIVVLSIPFWLVSLLLGAMLPARLPVSALMAVCPLVAALVLVHRDEGARRLLARVVRPWGRGRWYLAAVTTMPVITAAVYGLAALSGRPLPAPTVTVAGLALSAVVFVIAAAAEEVGWSAYAADPLLSRWGTARTGLLIGTVWAAWHIVPWLQVRSVAWVAWQCLFTIAARVLIVQLYERAGRAVPVAIAFHAMINICYALWPDAYTPMPVALLTTATALIVRSGRGCPRRP